MWRISYFVYISFTELIEMSQLLSFSTSKDLNFSACNHGAVTEAASQVAGRRGAAALTVKSTTKRKRQSHLKKNNLHFCFADLNHLIFT